MQARIEAQLHKYKLFHQNTTLIIKTLAVRVLFICRFVLFYRNFKSSCICITNPIKYFYFYSQYIILYIYEILQTGYIFSVRLYFLFLGELGERSISIFSICCAYQWRLCRFAFGSLLALTTPIIKTLLIISCSHPINQSRDTIS